MLKLIEHHIHNPELLAFTGRDRKSLQMNGRNKSAGILLVFKGICLKARVNRLYVAT